MKTQRVTLLVSPEDKRRFKKLADDRGVSVSEFIRQAVNAYRDQKAPVGNVTSLEETRELSLLTREIRNQLPAMRKSLRSAIASTSRVLAGIEARRSGR